MNAMINEARRLFDMGGPECRDALRTIANSVLSDSAQLEYEGGAVLPVETVYRALESVPFTGDGLQMLPPDEVYALDNLLNKGWRKDFHTALSNMALTMYCTEPRTAGKGFWPSSQSDCSSLITRAFIWLVTQHGLINMLTEKDAHLVSHTRLPQFIIALQTAGRDEGYARHFTLYRPQDDTGAVTSTNFIPEELVAKLRAEAASHRPVEYHDVPKMSFDALATLCERLDVIGPNSLKKEPCRCGCDDEDDCDCEEDEYQTREDFDVDGDDLREAFYDKFGDPDDIPDIDEEVWVPCVSRMQVEIDLPVVTLPRPEPASKPRPGMRSKQRVKSMPKPRNTRLDLTHDQQIWHELDSKSEFGDRSFAITLVSRHTCGVNRSVATTREALAIASMILDVNK